MTILIRSLDKVLKDANFEELPHEEVTDAHRKRTLRVEVKAEHDDFREVRFYKRGRHVEQLEVKEWFGLRRREVEIEVFDDIVLVVAMKSQAEIGSRRELRILKRRKIIPGTVLLKYFRNIACGDLYALFPNARVVMTNFDKAFLGVPAIAGGIPILLKLYATISVLFLVAGIYLGGSGSVKDADIQGALVALMGIVALGGFAVSQWLKYQHQTLKHHMELTENIYFRNVNNNAGIFDYLIATAEDQENRQAFGSSLYLGDQRNGAPCRLSLHERRSLHRGGASLVVRHGVPPASKKSLHTHRFQKPRSVRQPRLSTSRRCC